MTILVIRCIRWRFKRAMVLGVCMLPLVSMMEFIRIVDPIRAVRVQNSSLGIIRLIVPLLNAILDNFLPTEAIKFKIVLNLSLQHDPFHNIGSPGFTIG